LDCDEIVTLNLNTKEEKVLVERVKEYPSSDSMFPGAFPSNFLPNPFVRIGERHSLVFETCWMNRHALVLCDLSNGKINPLDFPNHSGKTFN